MPKTVLPETVPIRLLVAAAVDVLKEFEKFDVAVEPLLATAAPMDEAAEALPLLLFCPVLLSLAWYARLPSLAIAPDPLWVAVLLALVVFVVVVSVLVLFVVVLVSVSVFVVV
jgi:hypothetical protein